MSGEWLEIGPLGWDAAARAEAAAADAQAARDETVIAATPRTDWSGAYEWPAAQVKAAAYFARRLTGNSTIAFPPGRADRRYTVTLDIKQDATGGRTLTLSGVKWVQQTPPAISTAPNAHDLIHVLWNGEEWLAMVSGQAFAYTSGGGA